MDDTTEDQVNYDAVRPYLAANPAIEQYDVRGVGHARILRHLPVVQRLIEFLNADD